MVRSDVAALNFNVSHTIAFVQTGDSNVTLTLQNMWLLRATRLPQDNGLSGPLNQATAPYIVEFVDRRHILCKFAKGGGTALLASPNNGGNYNPRPRLSSATSAGSTSSMISWNAMCQDIWR